MTEEIDPVILARLEKLERELAERKQQPALSREEFIKLARQHSLVVAEKKMRDKKYRSVSCNGGCGHIFVRRFQDHVNRYHRDNPDIGFTIDRPLEGGLVQ